MRKVIDAVIDGGGYACAVVVVVISSLQIFEVVTRYLLKRPTAWAGDVSMYLILYFTFLGAAWVLKGEGHVKVELITSWLSPRAEAFWTGVTSVVCLVACSIFFWEGTKATWEAYKIGNFIERGIVMPRSLILWVMPFGTFLLCIQFIRRGWHHFLTFHKAGKKRPEEVREKIAAF